MKQIMFVLAALFLIAGCTEQTTNREVEVIGNTNTQTINPPSTSEETVKEVDLIIGHTSYNPNEIRMNLGQMLKINARAAPRTGDHNHGVTIDEFNIDEAVTTEDPANPVVIEVTPTERGTYIIYCKSCEEGPFGTSHPRIRASLIVE